MTEIVSRDRAKVPQDQALGWEQMRVGERAARIGPFQLDSSRRDASDSLTNG